MPARLSRSLPDSYSPRAASLDLIERFEEIRLGMAAVFPAGDDDHVRRWSPLDGVRHRTVAPPATVDAVLAATRALLATAADAA